MATEQLDTNMAIAEIDPETKKIKATPYFEDYLYNLVVSTGGETSSLVAETLTSILTVDQVTILNGLIKVLSRKVDDLINSDDIAVITSKVKQIETDTMSFVGKVVTSNYTAIHKDWVEARNKAIITLPANPLVNDQVIVSNGDGTSIKISGNGNDIKYKITYNSINIGNQGTSLHFQLFEYQLTQYWRIR